MEPTRKLQPEDAVAPPAARSRSLLSFQHLSSTAVISQLRQQQPYDVFHWGRIEDLGLDIEQPEPPKQRRGRSALQRYQQRRQTRRHPVLNPQQQRRRRPERRGCCGRRGRRSYRSHISAALRRLRRRETQLLARLASYQRK